MTWPEDPRRILLVRPDNLGDVVLLSPAVAAIRNRYPGATITLLASYGGAEAAALLPSIDEVIRHRPVWQELQAGRESVAAEFALIEELRAREFDSAIVFSSFAQSALPAAMTCFLAGIPVRAGYAERFAGRVLTDAVEPPALMHEAKRNIHLVRSLGIEVGSAALSITVPGAAQVAADAALESLGVREPFVVIAPGASAAARRYPPERFAVVAAETARRLGVDMLVTGSGRERPLLETVVEQSGDERVSGIVPADVPMLAGVLRRAAGVVCNNSLTMHLAEALGVPSVVTYSGTDLEAHWKPRFSPTRLLTRPVGCAPCYGIECVRALECLEIAPSEVVDALAAFVEAPTAEASSVVLA